MNSEDREWVDSLTIGMLPDYAVKGISRLVVLVRQEAARADTNWRGALDDLHAAWQERDAAIKRAEAAEATASNLKERLAVDRDYWTQESLSARSWAHAWKRLAKRWRRAAHEWRLMALVAIKCQPEAIYTERQYLEHIRVDMRAKVLYCPYCETREIHRNVQQYLEHAAVCTGHPIRAVEQALADLRAAVRQLLDDGMLSCHCRAEHKCVC